MLSCTWNAQACASKKRRAVRGVVWLQGGTKSESYQMGRVAAELHQCEQAVLGHIVIYSRHAGEQRCDNLISATRHTGREHAQHCCLDGCRHEELVQLDEANGNVPYIRYAGVLTCDTSAARLWRLVTSSRCFAFSAP